MATFNASLTNLRVLLLQSRDYSCYVSRRIPTPPLFRLQKHSDLRAHEFAHSPDLWHQPRRSNVICIWGWKLCGINPAIIALPWNKFTFINLLRLLVSVWSQILCVSISEHYTFGLCDICCHLLTHPAINSIFFSVASQIIDKYSRYIFDTIAKFSIRREKCYKTHLHINNRHQITKRTAWQRLAWHMGNRRSFGRYHPSQANRHLLVWGDFMGCGNCSHRSRGSYQYVQVNTPQH